MTAAPEIKIREWHGCYDGRWMGILTDPSMAHPAKFAPNLIRRIFAHGLERGYWRKGDIIGDCFGGIAGGGVMAGFAGLSWVGVELEQKFCELGRTNIGINRKFWDADVTVDLLQGDSRNFAALAGQSEGMVTSPPYADSVHDGNGIDQTKLTGNPAGPNSQAGAGGYGNTDGNIGNLKEGKVGAVVTSPPYGETLDGGGPDTHTDRMQGSVMLGMKEGYGKTPGQIGKMGRLDGIATSPPFQNSIHREGEWGNSLDPQKNSHPQNRSEAYVARNKATENYGESEGQIGITTNETYWQAMALVYEQCRLALKPGGYLAVVIKSFVKGGKIVDLPAQTLALLVSLGFEPVEIVHAMLTKTTKRAGLFGVEQKTVARKSFFRRLAESKGSPPIDFEVVLFVRKAGGAA